MNEPTWAQSSKTEAGGMEGPEGFFLPLGCKCKQGF